jgi:ubiquinone biosynthesis monooxygenase Coq7
MALTQAVETAIDEHYAEQAQALKAVSPELVTIVEDFRQDEAHHRQTAIDQGAELAPFHRLFSSIIQAGCRVAIKVSERI